ncbi:MAG: hypothetical protein DMG05_02635 [Acidobacteria bacterium]|nr:MAG: hypothetical protein DMG05_02635 [Acidobacteriota bacterium]
MPGSSEKVAVASLERFFMASRMMCMLVLLYAVLPSKGPARTRWTPQHFWGQQSAYAGSRACQGCHANLYKIQEASNHARSLRPLKEIEKITSCLPFRLMDPSSQTELFLSRKPDGNIELSVRKDGKEDQIILEWAFGAGAKGITPVGRRDNGQFVEGRLSWYETLGTFDLTAGARERIAQDISESLGRSLGEEERSRCFGCHTTGSTAESPIPKREEMGIRCERCHGPGLEHIRSMASGNLSDRKIFHPGRLDGFSQAQLCGECHGPPPADSDFDAIRYIQQKALTVRFPSQRMVLSRCFNEADANLKCSTCHNPHANIAATRTHYDKICLGCHRLEVRKRSAVCPVAKDNCVSCHMPKGRVMVHSEFTDHWIRATRAGVTTETKDSLK